MQYRKSLPNIVIRFWDFKQMGYNETNSVLWHLINVISKCQNKMLFEDLLYVLILGMLWSMDSSILLNPSIHTGPSWAPINACWQLHKLNSHYTEVRGSTMQGTAHKDLCGFYPWVDEELMKVLELMGEVDKGAWKGRLGPACRAPCLSIFLNAGASQ